jgi:lantibiotic modifying enzyme
MTVASCALDTATMPFAPERALETAADIAAVLVTDALWSGERCTWVGAEPLEQLGPASGPTSAGRLTYRALGPDLYAGTSGIAVFLAENAAQTRDVHTRRTAIGAIRHALSRQDDIRPEVRGGFYIGWSGVGYAAIRVGELLNSIEAVEQGSELLRRMAAVTASVGEYQPAGADGSINREFDLVAGDSGAVLALLYGHRTTGGKEFLADAVEAAERLLRGACRHDAGWSWRTPGVVTTRDLTGISHGASGVAVALTEVYRATHDERFAAYARQAMRYENHWFDWRKGNWPDFRLRAGEGRRPGRPETFTTLWCHGAPGIALARMHASRYLTDAQWAEDAMAAIRTTAKATRSFMADGLNFSLCHGLAGNGECMRHAAQAGITDDADLVADIAWLGVQLYSSAGQSWPCGTHTDLTPNLMLGLAGIGYFYMRHVEPDIPSILLPVSR